MGLPLAPELARMCTAYLLEHYEPPHDHCLTIYFDDVAATYPPNDLPLGPYNLKETEPNQTQDARYDPETKKFTPYNQPYRQPVLLHPHSHHPSQKMCEKTYFGSAFRACQICTDPADTLQHLLTKYLPALHRLGHNATDVVTNLTEITYFPIRTAKKEKGPYTSYITYAYSATRPTHTQLKSIQKEDFRLISNIPLAPLRSLQNYTPPLKSKTHSVYPCPTYSCNTCRSYEQIIDSQLQVPIIPCTRFRCLYIIFYSNPEKEKIILIDTTNMGETTLITSLNLNTIKRHLTHDNMKWQILALYPATYKAIKNKVDAKQLKWTEKLKDKFLGCKIYTIKEQKTFEKQTTN